MDWCIYIFLSDIFLFLEKDELCRAVRSVSPENFTLSVAANLAFCW